MGGSESFIDSAKGPGQKAIPAQWYERPRGRHNPGVGSREKCEDGSETKCDFAEPAHENTGSVRDGRQRLTQHRRFEHPCCDQNYQPVENADDQKR